MKHLFPFLASLAILFMVSGCKKKDRALPQFDITVTIKPDNAGTVSPGLSGKYTQGDTVTLTAKAKAGYHFIKWTGDKSSTNASLKIIVNGNLSLTAQFSQKVFGLTTDTTGEGKVKTEVIREADATHSKQVKLTALPSENWEFVKWEGDTTDTKNPITLTLYKPMQVTAVFKHKFFYLLANKVTVGCPLAKVGDTGRVNGILYTKREARDITPQNAATTCTSGITDMSNLFNSKKNFNADIGSWDVSSVTDMQGMFWGASAFNQNISSWDVSNVTDMEGMFHTASAFNQNIGGWDISNVINMYLMFYAASAFNQDIGNWDVSNVTNMRGTFYNASAFNGDIGDWDVSKVTNMRRLFDGAASFNRDISSWDVSKVTDMRSMFFAATSFNQDLSHWDVKYFHSKPGYFSDNSALSLAHQPQWLFHLMANGVTVGCPVAEVGETGKVNGITYTKRKASDITPANAATTCTSGIADMSSLFANDKSFNADIGSWDVSSVTDMRGMFYGAESFNADIGDWDVSKVTDMYYMFQYANAFNGDIGGWNVSSVANMQKMFYDAHAFNRNISGWDVSKVTDMSYMFSGARIFNQDIGGWNVGKVTDMIGMFRGTLAFDRDLTRWCVKNITSEPKDFSWNSALINAHKPKWGTCPGK